MYYLCRKVFVVVTCYKAVTIAKASGSCPKKQTQRDSDIASEFFALKRLSFFIFLLTRSLMAQSQIMAVRLARCLVYGLYCKRWYSGMFQPYHSRPLLRFVFSAVLHNTFVFYSWSFNFSPPSGPTRSIRRYSLAPLFRFSNKPFQRNAIEFSQLQ